MDLFSTHIIRFLSAAVLGGCLLLPMETWAQLSDSTDQRGILRIQKFSARAGALADATVGDPSHLAVINVNPAGLSFVPDLKIIELNVSHNWNNNVAFENFTLPAFRINNHAFATQFAIHHDRGFNSLNMLGTNPMPQPKITMYQLDVIYSYVIRDVLSIGVFNNFSFAENSIAQYSTYYAIIGLMYAPSPSLSYGLAFRGLGRNIFYNVNSPQNTTLGSQNIRETLELGATLKLPVDSKKTYLVLSLANEKQFGEKNIWYKAGLELKNFSHLALRTGLLFQPERNIYAPRLGIGLNINRLTVDYGISYSKELYERYHQLGITLHLNKIQP